MIRACLLILLGLASSTALAQERCATNAIGANTNRAENQQDFENWLQSSKSKAILRKSARLYGDQQALSVPVVFHVVHDGSEIGVGSNLSEAKILEQLDIINADFRRQNEDASNTPEIFLPVATDTEINFVLAKQDPEGMPTNGIVRIQGSKKTYRPREDDNLLKTESFWPQDQYMNVYITDLASGNLGYAQFPFSNLPGIASELANYESTDGVVLDYNWVGMNTNTGAFDSHGRTATHEIGHYLGLRHVWGDGGCFRDDFCDDTPPDSGSTKGCPDTKISCEDQRAMFENYMDYTNDECMNVFTICQKERMHTVLLESPRRSSLLTSPGLSEPQLVANNLGIRSIISPKISTCEPMITPGVQVRNYGNNLISRFGIDFYVNGEKVDSETVNANLESGATMEVIFEPIFLPGDKAHDISFQITTVNNGIDADSSNDNKTIQIGLSDFQSIPYFEDFSSGVSYYTQTENRQASSWFLTTAPDTSFSNQAAALPFFNSRTNYGYKDMLVTGSLDLSALTSAQLSFSYAYASRSTEELDGLLVICSTDCGETFPKENIVFERYGRSLRTAGYSDFEFIPGEDNDWEDINLNITKFAGEEYVKIAFVGINGTGNNLYLDNISVTSANLLAYDVGIKSIDRLPVVTCDKSTRPRIEIKNYGYEDITDFELQLSVNGQNSSKEFTGLRILSGETETVNLEDAFSLNPGLNNFEFNISMVNGRIDDQTNNNSTVYYTILSDDKDNIPVQETFDVLSWQIADPNGISFFDTTLIDNNPVLATNSFNNEAVGKSYLVSPILSVGNYNQGAIRFNYSYARRQGYNDNLKVLLSANCGDTYSHELLSLNAEQLAITNSNTEWMPSGETDWKQAFIDISEHLIWPEVRIALVFTNGNGNRLYIDNLNVLTTNNPALPEFENNVRLYPNPAEDKFYVAFNLPKKEELNVRLMDMSGRIVFDEQFPNIINQTLTLKAPHQSGFYILQVTGNGVKHIKRLFIK